MKWIDESVMAFDFETTGALPEYALQPWRYKQGIFKVTSLSVARCRAGKLRSSQSTEGSARGTYLGASHRSQRRCTEGVCASGA
jgi:hypothetical protein